MELCSCTGIDIGKRWTAVRPINGLIGRHPPQLVMSIRFRRLNRSNPAIETQDAAINRASGALSTCMGTGAPSMMWRLVGTVTPTAAPAVQVSADTGPAAAWT